MDSLPGKLLENEMIKQKDTEEEKIFKAKFSYFCKQWNSSI